MSLNISTKNNKTDLKILALTKNDNDIVLVSDIRLNSLKQSAAVHDTEKKFLLKGYDFIYNSKSSSRGVGILIKSKLAYVVHEKIYDYDDNYLLLDITVDNFRFVLGSIYGPNRDELKFFDNLKLDVRNIGQKLVIIGGDWNATFDSNPVPHNIDVINMASIPSKKRSLKIATLARSLNLMDPYRFFNPERRDFTFIQNIIDELDFSVKKVKKNSAPGGDGISNRFILKNWNLLRVPLFKYATTCFEKGTLTNNFRSANVILIPKKGDCTCIACIRLYWIGPCQVQQRRRSRAQIQ